MEKIRVEDIRVLWNILSKTPYVVDFSHRNIYFDEPNFYQYSVGLVVPLKGHKKPYDFTLNGSGYSFFSRREALLKALGESCERLSLLLPNQKFIKTKKMKDLKENILDPKIYANDVKEESVFGWVDGKKNNSSKCFIPAQLVYLAYNKTSEFNLKVPSVSTGAAGGFTHEGALLGGLYEVIERDIFMNMYLAKLKPIKIKNSSIKNVSLKRIFEKIQRYGLEVNIFEVPNDFEIPAYVVLILDRTGLGQAVSAGSKVNIDSFKALLGALTEACMIRMGSHLISLEEVMEKKGKLVTSLKERKMIWYLPGSIKYLDFMVNQTPQKYVYNHSSKNVVNELQLVEKKLSKRGFDYFHVDVSASFLKGSGYRVYKVIIPGLQQLYLDEHEKAHINQKRLAEFAKFYNVEKIEINNIPHPFL